MKQNIIFIGMSGSGKTTVSKYLANNAGYQLIDTDRLIEEYCKEPHLQTIVNRYEANYENFLQLERKVIAQYFSKNKVTQCAIATGGSLCYSAEVFNKFNGNVYYFHISWEGLSKRIKNFGNRGVICFKNSLKEEYLHRIALYKQLANITINCDNKTINEVAQEVLENEKTKL